MIRRSVNAALLVRDGFTGKTLPDGSGTRCLLDGRPFRPIWKQDGYLVLADLAPGGHTLSLLRPGYQEETVLLDIRDGAFREGIVSLKPGAGYIFPAGTARLELTLTEGKQRRPLSGAELWAGMAGETRLKLAQDKKQPLNERIRVFYSGAAALFPVPGWFLAADGKKPELLFLRALHAEEAELASPMGEAHARGTELIPVQSYTADAGGNLSVLFRRAGTASLSCGGNWKTTLVQPGRQRLEWNL